MRRLTLALLGVLLLATPAGADAVNVRTFGAKGDSRILASCTTTAGVALLTCPAGNFQPVSVGQAVYLAGAMTTGDLLTTVVSVQSITQAILAATPDRTASGLFGRIGTDDTAAIQAAFNAAGAGVLSTARAQVYVPAGQYLVSSTLTAGAPGGRSMVGVILAGDGRGASILHWVGATGGPLRLRNAHQATIRDLEVSAAAAGAYGVWLAVDDGQSAYQTMTSGLAITGPFVQALRIGGGALLSSGQANAGLHDSLYLTGFTGQGIVITGANTEMQTFRNLNVIAGPTATAVIQTFNGRGVQILGGEMDLNSVAAATQYVLTVTGGTIFGAPYTIRDIRIEGLASLAKFDADGGGTGTAPVIFTAENVVAAEPPFGNPPGPTDIVTFRQPGIVTIRSCVFVAALSRVSFIAIREAGYTTLIFEGNQVNNAQANRDLGALIHVTNPTKIVDRQAGVAVYLRGNHLTGGSVPFAGIERLTDRQAICTPSLVTAGACEDILVPRLLLR